MSVSISISGTSDLEAQINQLIDAVSNPADGLMQGGEVALNDVIEASESIWGVETGEYSSSWQLVATGTGSVQIYNDSDHAAPLEYGWTRGNTVIESPGVLIPTVENDIDAIAQELQNWLQNQS